MHAALQGLVTLHKNGLVHRDVRLDNILWRLDQPPFLMDLELASRAGLKVVRTSVSPTLWQ